MDYSSEKPDEILDQLLSTLKSVAISPTTTKLLSKTRTQLFNARRILFLTNNDISWGKRKYHELLQQTSVATCNSNKKKLKEHNITRDDCRTKFTLCVNPNITCFSSARESTDVLGNSSSTLSESRYSVSRESVIQNSTQCALLNRLEPDQDVVMLQDSIDDPSNISKEGFPLDKTLWQISEEPIRAETNQACENTIGGKNVPTLTYMHSEDTVDSAKSPSPVEEPLRRSNRLTNFIGDYLQETVIPIGDRFQAGIPDCIGLLAYNNDMDNLKWLGEKVWPVENQNMDVDMGIIGRGRPDSSLCSCITPNSIDCVKLHIKEKNAQLQSQIGDTFYLWDFEQMGEEVSNSWTLEERTTFKNLFKRKTSMSKERFWKRIFSLFPHKRRENIVSYYFNVFALNSVKKQVELHYDAVDSDDDEPDNNHSTYKATKRSWLC